MNTFLPFRSLGLCAALVATSCGETTNVSPSQLNLDRPVDIAFACWGGLRINNGAPEAADQPVVLSPQPQASCTIRSGPHESVDPAPVPVGQGDLTPDGPLIPNVAWYGLILQSAPGTVAIAQWGTKPATAFGGGGGDVNVLDADPLTPGKNSISVGEDPVAIVTDVSGCFAVTANAGSCDMSVVDINSALDTESGVIVNRLEVTNASGEPIRARPAAMVVEPQSEAIGFACPATSTGLVYVAYPSCHLVAAVDTATGTVVGGIQYDAAGVPSIVDGNVTCNDECSGGAMFSPGPRPVALDLELEPDSTSGSPTRRLVIGADNLPSITLVELGPDSRPLSLSQIALEDNTGNLGVTGLALSPEIQMGGVSGMIDDQTSPGGAFQFVYAIATDDTIRVADILTLGRECDTQVDPRLLRDLRSVRELSCLPVGEPTTPARRPGARGPGIELLADAIPTSVEVIRSEHVVGDPRVTRTPSKLVGYFGFVTAANGATFIINIDDDDHPDLFDPQRPLSVPIPLSLPHQLRDSIPDRGQLATESTEMDGIPMTTQRCEFNGPVEPTGALIGGPRAAANPARNVPAGLIAPEKATQLPGIRQLTCEGKNALGQDTTLAISELAFAADEATRDREFPDLRALRGEENWTLTWEGSLSNDVFDTDVDGPAVRESELRVDALGMRLVDQTRPYCDAGVEPFDIVQMRGCDPSIGNLDCPINYRCYVHPQSQVTGLGACILESEADRLAEACKDFLTSIRRYTVATAASGELSLLPRRLELRATPLDGCVDDAQCEFLADYSARQATSLHPKDDTTTDPKEWVCRVDPTRKPRGAENKRCNVACDTAADCLAGTVCQGGDMNTAEVKEGLCMEGVTPPQSCVNAPQRYELRAGEAFAVLGQRSGFVHPIIAEAGTDRCIRDPGASPYLVGRLPLTADPCDPTADPISGRLPDGSFGPNPCTTTVTHAEVVLNYNPGTCTLGSPSSSIQERQAPAVLFRNKGLNLTIVDPFYPGDNQCIADRGGYMGTPLDRIPLAFTGYQLEFRQTAGFSPLIVPITPSFPVKVVRGPTDSIWVIDEGDFISTSVTQPSTRGKVFRVEHHGLSTVNILE